MSAVSVGSRRVGTVRVFTLSVAALSVYTLGVNALSANTARMVPGCAGSNVCSVNRTYVWVSRTYVRFLCCVSVVFLLGE